MTQNYAPCEWPMPAEGEGSPCSSDTLEGLPPADRERIEEMAIGLLWAWTGRKYGLCEIAVRPCRVECAQASATFWGQRGGSTIGAGWVPFVYEGQWFNLGCGVCGFGPCSCAPDASTALMLPPPVAEIVSVTVDGELLPPSAYVLRNEVLYRVDGGTWPMCNDQAGDVLDPDSGAWEIVYKRGLPVPVGGQIAALKLAEELAKAWCSDSTCELPSRVQSVTRQGVSLEVVSTEFSEMKEGRTGIWLIDSWVASTLAPAFARPAVLSPDMLPGSQTDTFHGLGRGRTW